MREREEIEKLKNQAIIVIIGSLIVTISGFFLMKGIWVVASGVGGLVLMYSLGYFNGIKVTEEATSTTEGDIDMTAVKIVLVQIESLFNIFTAEGVYQIDDFTIEEIDKAVAIEGDIAAVKDALESIGIFLRNSCYGTSDEQLKNIVNSAVEAIETIDEGDKEDSMKAIKAALKSIERILKKLLQDNSEFAQYKNKHIEEVANAIIKAIDVIN